MTMFAGHVLAPPPVTGGDQRQVGPTYTLAIAVRAGARDLPHLFFVEYF